jgi:hypothetical protein
MFWLPPDHVAGFSTQPQRGRGCRATLPPHLGNDYRGFPRFHSYDYYGYCLGSLYAS